MSQRNYEVPQLRYTCNVVNGSCGKETLLTRLAKYYPGHSIRHQQGAWRVAWSEFCWLNAFDTWSHDRHSPSASTNSNYDGQDITASQYITRTDAEWVCLIRNVQEAMVGRHKEVGSHITVRRQISLGAHSRAKNISSPKFETAEFEVI